MYDRQIRLRSLIIAKKSRRKVSTRLITRLANKLKIDGSMKLTIEAIKTLQATAWKNYWSVKPSARELRQQFIKQKIEKGKKKETPMQQTGSATCIRTKQDVNVKGNSNK